MSEENVEYLKLCREDLKERFKAGRMPTEEDFMSLIDSMVNCMDEGFDVTEENCSFKFVLIEDVSRNTVPDGTQKVNANQPAFFKDAFLQESLTFESYVDGAFNAEAYRAARIISKNPGKSYNPLFIYSNSGLGKTHLLHAIGNYIQNVSKPGAKVLYI